MKESTKDKFEQSVQQLSMVFQITPRDFKAALAELRSFDKTILFCCIAKEMGIPLWEAIHEGKESMDHYYEKTQQECQSLWENIVMH
ncbi:MAG TPA: hypothetical protein VMZ91_16110 [Candidatus Paceibacterota bacterium]|nr:hypothetical protein [Candidatus Paceibacterota bacterium]